MMIAMLIEREVEITLNWSFASALAVVLAWSPEDTHLFPRVAA